MTHVSGLCGVDEAGRGPWAGPVCAGAVILGPQVLIPDLADSKALSAKQRASLAPKIQAGALAWGLGWASPAEIDALNIRQATHLAMRRAISAMDKVPNRLLIDGNDVPSDLPCPAEALVGGDARVPAISAASILAKTARDALMVEMESQYPGYGFAAHKGYGTATHGAALKALGPCAIHRRSFAPVARAMAAHAGA